jgi:hypothetical protein
MGRVVRSRPIKRVRVACPEDTFQSTEPDTVVLVPLTDAQKAELEARALGAGKKQMTVLDRMHKLRELGSASKRNGER